MKEIYFIDRNENKIPLDDYPKRREDVISSMDNIQQIGNKDKEYNNSERKGFSRHVRGNVWKRTKQKVLYTRRYNMKSITRFIYDFMVHNENQWFTINNLVTISKFKRASLSSVMSRIVKATNVIEVDRLEKMFRYKFVCNNNNYSYQDLMADIRHLNRNERMKREKLPIKKLLKEDTEKKKDLETLIKEFNQKIITISEDFKGLDINVNIKVVFDFTR